MDSGFDWNGVFALILSAGFLFLIVKSSIPRSRSFKPDFLLVRQNLRDASEDYRNLLLGFKYGDVPAVNSLDSVYNFQVRKNLPPYFSFCVGTKHSFSFFLTGQALGLCSHDEGPEQAGQGELPAHRSDVLSESQRNGERQLILLPNITIHTISYF